jgi:hypothetical protein
MPAQATALFRDRHAVHAAIEQLVQAGFPRDAIGVLMSGETHELHFAATNARTLGPAPTSGVLGAIVSGIVEVASVTIDGRAALAAGPIAPELVTRARNGGRALDAALVDAGVPPIEASFVARKVGAGCILVAVYGASDRAELARDLMLLAGGEWLEAA